MDNRDQDISYSENQKWCAMTESRILIFNFVVHSNAISEPFQAKRDRKYLVKAWLRQTLTMFNNIAWAMFFALSISVS